jgi:excinuclease ABC subunit B
MFEEFMNHLNKVILISATPAEFERERSSQVVEQLVRPTGLLEPEVEIRGTEGQIDDLIEEIRWRVDKGERCLVTTLTKRMAEELSEYLLEMGVKAHYLHSEVNTLDRVEILRDLRLGAHDVIVGINLLREGLDLPEVSLVAILDADKEGYLRSKQALIQTMGRAARHVEGKAILYADQVTSSMREAISEVARRRKIQEDYNWKHGITPEGIKKEIRDITQRIGRKAETLRLEGKEVSSLIAELEREMRKAAKDLEFERAALLRDKIYELRKNQSPVKVR